MPRVHGVCDWSRTLRWFRLHSISFDGGEITLESGDDQGEGIAQIGVDVVAVVYEDRQYWIPFAALRQVCGSCRPRPNTSSLLRLHTVISSWIDESWMDEAIEEDPADGDVISWYSIITRSGQEIAGVVLGVRAEGVQMQKADGERVSIPWAQVGAAVELLE